ncbi:hypothetical protein CC1G_14819 [Coprinopsis cinerea okayama7|uniref:Uncharacterized protein n=1 Tax=Coprinopsis cinerea (strain Okayama-7 / 130 / ATCC MYA-4618 / FGSC 9003) TaxID=240176 RepID=D6RNP7_COPC7|nr:hypothetical protein CC1G_14819 [Coprinopsis cinerea okayama7\|eukprot:XP_002910840.1 hypothetical protein CC1G_14819 [Coprinopsis cinerea okayama7\
MTGGRSSLELQGPGQEEGVKGNGGSWQPAVSTAGGVLVKSLVVSLSLHRVLYPQASPRVEPARIKSSWTPMA